MAVLKLLYKVVFALLFGVLVACNNHDPHQIANAENGDKPSSPIVGSDTDAHACKASAGYQWSALRNECIRIFEVGIALNAMSDNVDKTLAAYAVFSTDADHQQVELFIPNEQSVILDKTPNRNSWQNKRYIFSEAVPKQYILEDTDKKSMYGGTIK